jgi:tetratricopeptide (TPR) repeat protein
MARRKRHQAAAPEKELPPAALRQIGRAPGRARWRNWLFRLGAATLAPLFFLAALEGALRLAGFGYPTGFFIPRVFNGAKVVTENRQFGWRFFGPALSRTPFPMVTPAVKPPGTVRIFVLGESAAYGDPQPAFSLPRMLEVLLQTRYPVTRIQVVNAAMVAINSNVILPIAKDCVGQPGDIWVIYMGNNEVVGPDGSGTVFGPAAPSLALIRASIAAKGTRIGELLSAFPKRIGAERPEPNEWTGTLLFVQHQVPMNDPRMSRVYSNFAQNLDDIIRTGLDSRVKMVVSTVVSNLKDCPPFGSRHREGLTAGQLQEWDRYYRLARDEQESGNVSGAQKNYEKAVQIDDQFAELQFCCGQCALALGQHQEAKRHFVQARDEDTLRFRCDSRINDIIRKTAANRASEGVAFFDAESLFAKESPQDLPGNNFLYEHVHLNFEGTYLLARNLAEQVARLLPEALTEASNARPDWLKKSECAAKLVWSDWSLFDALNSLRFDAPPFSYQLGHQQRSGALNAEKKRLAAELTPDALRRIAGEYDQAIAAAPEDWILQKNRALLLQKLGNLSEASEGWRQVLKLLPYHAEPYLHLGILLSLQGHTDESAAQFAAAFDLDPNSARTVLVKLAGDAGKSLADQGNLEAAARLYGLALRFKPDLAEAHIDLGNALILLGKPDQAREHFKTSLSHPPNTPEGLVALGKACDGQGWADSAVASYQAALQLDPDNLAAHENLGIALLKQDKEAEAAQQFRETLRLDPGNQQAIDQLNPLPQVKP